MLVVCVCYLLLFYCLLLSLVVLFLGIVFRNVSSIFMLYDYCVCLRIVFVVVYDCVVLFVVCCLMLPLCFVVVCGLL